MTKIHVSKMTGKMEGFRAINFNPLENSYCSKMAKKEGTVCSFCYSRRMIATYRQSCNKPFIENAENMKQFLLDQELPRFMVGERVRFLGHGELETATQMLNFIRIAECNPLTRFTMWTKRFDLVQIAVQFGHKIPSNLTLIQSSKRLNHIDRIHPLADAVFTVYEKSDSIIEPSFLCEGKKCGMCMHCYGPKDEMVGHIAEVLRK